MANDTKSIGWYIAYCLALILFTGIVNRIIGNGIGMVAMIVVNFIIGLALGWYWAKRVLSQCEDLIERVGITVAMLAFFLLGCTLLNILYIIL